MNMAVDVGNTFTKVGIFEKDSLKKKKVFDSLGELRDFLPQTPVENLIISSVKGDAGELCRPRPYLRF